MAGKKHSLVERGVASKRGGKFRLTVPGKKWLRRLKGEAENRRPVRVKAARHTWRSKRVLFVCFGGLHFSNVALSEFQKAAKKSPADADLLLDSCGTMGFEGVTLRELVPLSDFVVVTSNYVQAEKSFRGAFRGLKRKPKVFDISGENWQGIYNPGIYESLLKKIKSEIEKGK